MLLLDALRLLRDTRAWDQLELPRKIMHRPCTKRMQVNSRQFNCASWKVVDNSELAMRV
jgi:hypothetical protein